MHGEDCQEMRVRYDNHWPVDLVPEKSSIREIVPPGTPPSGHGNGDHHHDDHHHHE